MALVSLQGDDGLDDTYKQSKGVKRHSEVLDSPERYPSDGIHLDDGLDSGKRKRRSGSGFYEDSEWDLSKGVRPAMKRRSDSLTSSSSPIPQKDTEQLVKQFVANGREVDSVITNNMGETLVTRKFGQTKIEDFFRKKSPASHQTSPRAPDDSPIPDIDDEGEQIKTLPATPVELSCNKFAFDCQKYIALELPNILNMFPKITSLFMANISVRKYLIFVS